MLCCGTVQGWAASQFWRSACTLVVPLQTCFGSGISSESIHKSISRPSRSLQSRSALHLFMLLLSSKLKFHRFYRLHLGVEPSELSDGELACRSLCYCCPRGRAPLPCKPCFIVPLCCTAAGGESQTSSSPPFS